MWYEEQPPERVALAKRLVKEGRLEITNGGISMHDEAGAYYLDQINNMLYGNAFIKQEFGVAPRIGWQIDPFGHSVANARLFSEMGFDA